MEQSLFDRQIESYLQSIIPVRGKRKRWKQYNSCKSQILPQLPPEMHDLVIRQLAKRLRI